MAEGPAQEPIVQARFSWEFDDGSVLDDAIVLPWSEYHALGEKELAERKQDRAAQWKQTVDDARAYVPTDKEIESARLERLEALREQKEQVTAEFAVVEAEVYELEAAKAEAGELAAEK